MDVDTHYKKISSEVETITEQIVKFMTEILRSLHAHKKWYAFSHSCSIYAQNYI